MQDLSPRERHILFSVVTEYIQTGLPVGSRTLSRLTGMDLSAASIRNVLADLDEAGLLIQPHTSAGRIPTDRAIRFFIDTLMRVESVPLEQRAELDAKVAEIYAKSGEPLRDSGRLLSELSGAAAVVAPAPAVSRTLAQIRFIPTKRGQILAVVVFQDGTVENRFLEIEDVISEAELTRIHNMLSGVVEGRTLRQVRDLMKRRLADERDALDADNRRAFDLTERALVSAEREKNIVIEGQARLIDLPEYADNTRLKRLVVALEERQGIVNLLDKMITAGTVTVIVGGEAGELGGGQLSLVAAPFNENGQPAGAVGVLGPTRMDYAKVVPLVGATADAMSDAISRK